MDANSCSWGSGQRLADIPGQAIAKTDLERLLHRLYSDGGLGGNRELDGEFMEMKRETFTDLMRNVDPCFDELIRRVIQITDDSLQERCEYEYGETMYGEGNALPCGRDVVPGRNRCHRHVAD